MPRLFVLVLLLLVPVPLLAADLQLRLTTDDSFPLSTPEGDGVHDRLIGEALRRAGCGMQVIHLPAERAILNADAGIDDGNGVRVTGLSRQYPNLIEVPEKVTDYEFMAFTKQTRMTPNGWDSLKPYNVAYIIGWKILEENIREAKSITRVENGDQLFTLLAQGRADIAVYSRLEGYGLVKQKALRGIQSLEPPLASRGMFLYLNRRHAALVPRIADALRTMREDGTATAIVRDTLRRHLGEDGPWSR